MSNKTTKVVHLLGVRVDIVDWKGIENFCRQALIQAAPKMIATVNGEITLIADKKPEYRKVLNQSNLNIADSTNIIWVSYLKGYRFPERTPGSELLLKLCSIAQEMKKSVYFLGGREITAELTAQRVAELYPKLEIAGYSSADPDDEDIVAQIRRKNPDIVFVAYGAPKQETWIYENKEKITAKIMVGVGGTFDMISGRLPRAPQWMIRLHLEWLWRLYLEPKRVLRIFKAVFVFPVKALLFSK